MSHGSKTKCCSSSTWDGYNGRRVHRYRCSSCNHEWCDLCRSPAVIDIGGIKAAPCAKCGEKETLWEGNYSGGFPNYHS